MLNLSHGCPPSESFYLCSKAGEFHLGLHLEVVKPTIFFTTDLSVFGYSPFIKILE